MPHNIEKAHDTKFCKSLALMLDSLENIVNENIDDIEDIYQLKTHAQNCSYCKEILTSPIGRCLIQIIKNIKRSK